MAINFQVNPNNIGLNYHTIDLMQKTAENYSKKGSFCRKVANFFKSFIGQSDWQKTIRAAKKMYRTTIKNELLQQTGHVKTKELEATMKKVEKFVMSKVQTAVNLSMKWGVKEANGKEVSLSERDHLVQARKNILQQVQRAGIRLYVEE